MMHPLVDRLWNGHTVSHLLQTFPGYFCCLINFWKTPPVELTGSFTLSCCCFPVSLSLSFFHRCIKPAFKSKFKCFFFCFRSIQMSWMQSSRGWVCLFVKKVLPEAVFQGKEKEKSLTVHLVSITTAVHFSSPVALCVSFCMSKKDTKTIVHFWGICFHLIFWTHFKYHFRPFQHCLY